MDPILVGTTMDGAKQGWKLKPVAVSNNEEKKKAMFHDEMKRMNQLPPNSSYASHRLRVLNKILQLLSLSRTTSQDEELELLFSGLHL